MFHHCDHFDNVLHIGTRYSKLTVSNDQMYISVQHWIHHYTNISICIISILKSTVTACKKKLEWSFSDKHTKLDAVRLQILFLPWNCCVNKRNFQPFNVLFFGNRAVFIYISSSACASVVNILQVTVVSGLWLKQKWRLELQM